MEKPKQSQSDKTSTSKTQYLTFFGRAFWAKLYEPDEFLGAVRWSIDLYLDDDAQWELFEKSGIQKKVKVNEEGKHFQLHRPTQKLMGQKRVYFTPPFIYNKDELIVKYTDAEGKDLRSYEDDKIKPVRVGNPILIGNGSKVAVEVAVYPTARGPGNRFQSVKILDLIEYKRPDPAEVKPALADDNIPW